MARVSRVGGAPNWSISASRARPTNVSRRRRGYYLRWRREGCEARAVRHGRCECKAIDCGLRVCCRGAAELRARCADLDGD